MTNDPRFPRVTLMGGGRDPHMPAQGMRQAPAYVPVAVLQSPSAVEASQQEGLTLPPVSVRNRQKEANVVSLSIQIPQATANQASLRFLDESVTPRNMLGFRNASTTANIFIDFGTEAKAAVAGVGGSFLVLQPGDIVQYDTVVPQNDLYAVADAAGAVLAYMYSNYTP